MDDIFGTEVPQGEPQLPATEVVEEVATAAPPAAEDASQVPLKALEAERSKRREWRDKYHQLEGQLQALRQQPQYQQPHEPAERDPVKEAISAAQNERLDTSEMLAREKFGDKEVDEAFEKFQQAVAKDPSLYQRVMGQKHPWGAVVKEMQRQALLDEIGDDPAAYRERIRAELSAAPATTPKPVLPQSLASARSSGSRTAASFTGPTPLDDILK